MSKAPLITGCHKRRRDTSRRLRMPLAWSIGGNRTWLLFPRHIVSPCDQASHSLYLLPVNERSLRAIILDSAVEALAPRSGERQQADSVSTAEFRITMSSAAHTASSLTVGAVLDILHARARQHALDPSVATVIRTTPTATRFTLTKAQIGWLGCQGRTLVITGALNAARVLTPRVWAKEQRGTLGTKSRTLLRTAT
jgi:hypothetical protein